MPERRIEPVEIDGETIWVEVADAQGGPVGSTTAAAGDGFENTSLSGTARKLADAGLDKTIKSLAGIVKRGIEESAPQEWTLEFSVGIDGKSRVPFVAEAGVAGALKITATWKRE